MRPTARQVVDKLLEALPAVLYSGTDAAFWPPKVVYLTKSLADAWEYAYEAAASREGDGHRPQPIVMAVRFDSLPQEQLQPDDGGYAASEDTWQASLAEKGSVKIPFSASFGWRRIRRA